MEIRFDKIPEEQIVVEMEEQLKTNLIGENIKKVSRSGKTITIEGDSEDVPKRYIKFIVKKYLGRSVYKGQTKVIAINKNVFEVLFSEAKL
ncbi:MAG: 60S ribosomal protein L22 [Candidatus Hodarchaeales archaeon]